ncbi:MAG: sigma-70 family RNA polymerase sigma factor [Mucilaginibacter polytrichastri]|nr:sigma-70 family RNA polymerase sigma factor [Mucilaginibacter polytrichastri]
MNVKATKLSPENWAAEHAVYLYAFARKRVDEDDVIFDLVQDTFLAALEGITAFKGQSSERTWLTGILKNKVMDYYRRKASIHFQSAAGDAQADFFEEDGHWKKEYVPKRFKLDEQDPLERKEFNNILKACMTKLPGLWHAVFTMKFLDDEQSAIICRELRITPANYWVILHRAKLNLRNCLQLNGI